MTTSMLNTQLPSFGSSRRSRWEERMGLVWIYLLWFSDAQNVMRRNVLPMFMLTPMTSSKKCSVSKLGFKIRILAIRNISNGLNDDNAVQAEVEQRHTLLPRTKEEPPNAKYLQQIGKQDSKSRRSKGRAKGLIPKNRRKTAAFRRLR